MTFYIVTGTNYKDTSSGRASSIEVSECEDGAYIELSDDIETILETRSYIFSRKSDAMHFAYKLRTALNRQ